MVTLYQLTWESDLEKKDTWKLHESPMSVTTDRIAWVLRTHWVYYLTPSPRTPSAVTQFGFGLRVARLCFLAACVAGAERAPTL